MFVTSPRLDSKHSLVYSDQKGLLDDEWLAYECHESSLVPTIIKQGCRAGYYTPSYSADRA